MSERVVEQEIQQDVEPKAKPRRKSLLWAILGVIVIIGIGGIVVNLNPNLNGMCLEEGRKLSERELIDRYLLWEPWDTKNTHGWKSLKNELSSLTPDQKLQRMENNWTNHFGCCRLRSLEFVDTRFNHMHFWDKWFRGKYFYFIEVHFPYDHPPTDSDTHKESFVKIDSCGAVYGSEFEMFQTENQYHKSIERIKKYRLKQEQKI